MNLWTPISIAIATALLVILYRGAKWHLRSLRGTVKALRLVQLLYAASFTCLAVGAVASSPPLTIAGILLMVLPTFFVGTLVQLTGGPDPTWEVRHEIQAIMPLLQPQPLTDERRRELEARRAALSGLRSTLTDRTVRAIDEMLAEELRPDRDKARIHRALDELQSALGEMRASHRW